jgi:uracil-DNA glycosylase family 4
VKCRPPGNRDPLPAEINACDDYLERQISAINPQAIVTLGRFSMAKFFGGEKISSIHGRARKIDGRTCIAMYHPAAGLHQQSLKDTIRSDFKKIPQIMAEAERQSVEEQGKTEAPKLKEEPPEQLALF